MALARPERAYRYAAIATVFSVLGGILGWFIGYYAFETVAKPVLEFYGKYDAFEAMRGSAGADAILLMLVTSGLSHLPPIKVVTILSGAAQVNIWLFIASAVAARGARFFALAWLLRTYGDPIKALHREAPQTHRRTCRSRCCLSSISPCDTSCTETAPRR